jgi:hypothetical protein
MRKLPAGAVAAVAVILSAVTGVLTNLVTAKFQWSLVVATCTLVAVSAVFAWRSQGLSQKRTTSVVERAMRGSSIVGGQTMASAGATVKETADKRGKIMGGSITARGGHIDRRASDGTIEDRHTYTEDT